ncbi:hypothetical protein [Spirosoma pomorum]
MSNRALKLALLAGSLLMSWLGYTLVKSWLADWPTGVCDPWGTAGFWGKSLSLAGWLVAAIWFLLTRNSLARKK